MVQKWIYSVLDLTTALCNGFKEFNLLCGECCVEARKTGGVVQV